MTLVKEVGAQDFEKTYPLFAKFQNSRLSKEDWNSLNAGKAVELEQLPKMVKPFIEQEKSVKEK